MFLNLPYSNKTFETFNTYNKNNDSQPCPLQHYIQAANTYHNSMNGCSTDLSTPTPHTLPFSHQGVMYMVTSQGASSVLIHRGFVQTKRSAVAGYALLCLHYINPTLVIPSLCIVFPDIRGYAVLPPVADARAVSDCGIIHNTKVEATSIFLPVGQI